MNRNTVGLGWWGRSGTGVGAGSRARRQNRRRLMPELLVLEGRQLLASLMVMNTNSSGPNSLAQAIADANTNNQSNTINFVGPTFSTLQTITLGGSGLELKDTAGSQTIQAPAAGVIISGGGKSGVFQVDSGVTATLSGLTITDGYTRTGQQWHGDAHGLRGYRKHRR